jgi:DNA-directed RNA polymerase subunit L
MHVEIIQSEKDDFELKVDNPTIAELVRVYLNEQGIKFAAWRKEHPSKPVIMRIQTSSGTVKKAVSDAVGAIQKELDELTAVLKKSK